MEDKELENNETKEEKVIDENAHQYHTVDAKPVVLKDDYNFFFRSKFKYFASRVLIVFIGIFFVPFIHIFNGFTFWLQYTYFLASRQDFFNVC